MAICKDPNDQTQRNANAIASLDDVSFNGTLRPSFAATAIEQYSNLVAVDIADVAQNNIISRYVNQYGQEAFNLGLAAINNTLVNREVFQNNLSNYPDLQNRLNTGFPISPIEYANYMDEFLQNPNTVVSLVNSNTPLMQSQLNDFYRNNFTQSAIGSFCSLMPSVFGAISGFFDLVGDARQTFQDALDFVNNLEFSLQDLAKKFTMQALISKIKEQITKIVTDTINKVKGIIENLSFENVIGQVETFINNNVVKKFIELKEQAMSFFSEENIERLKKKVENLFNYATSLFKNPSLEEIQFLVYRFCSFAGQIENAINQIKKPIDDFTGDYNSVYNLLSAASNIRTGAAVSLGGAIRLSDEERKNRIDAAVTAAARQPDAPPQNMTIEEAGQVEELTWEKLKANTHPNFRIPFDEEGTTSWSTSDRIRVGQELSEGWTGTTVETRAGLIRLQKLYSEKVGRNVVFIISSGYRNELLNATIPEASSNSWHVQGKAFDIKWEGINLEQAVEVGNIARSQVGFQEVLDTRYGGSFVHVGNIKSSSEIHPEVRREEYPFVHPGDAARNVWTFETYGDAIFAQGRGDRPFGRPSNEGKVVVFRSNGSGGAITIAVVLTSEVGDLKWYNFTIEEYIADGGSVTAETRALDNIVRLPA